MSHRKHNIHPIRCTIHNVMNQAYITSQYAYTYLHLIPLRSAAFPPQVAKKSSSANRLLSRAEKKNPRSQGAGVCYNDERCTGVWRVRTRAARKSTRPLNYHRWKGVCCTVREKPCPTHTYVYVFWLGVRVANLWDRRRVRAVCGQVCAV